MWTPIEYTNDDSGFSVCLLDPESNLHFWVDVWVSNEDVECDWNQYIFRLDDEEDVQRKEIQEKIDNFTDATGTAICFLEEQGVLIQDNDGHWHYSFDEY